MAMSTGAGGETLTGGRAKVSEGLVYDYNINDYVSLRQEREIHKLKKQLEEKAKERSKTIASIVAHYYKK